MKTTYSYYLVQRKTYRDSEYMALALCESIKDVLNALDAISYYQALFSKTSS